MAQSDSYTTARNVVLQVNTARGVLSNDSDPEGNQMTTRIMTQTQHGVLQMEKEGGFKYTPDVDYAGLDSFSYRANDGSLDSNLVTVNINVNFTNRAPVATDDSYSIAGGATLNIAADGVLANDTDSDGNVLNVVIVSQPVNGALQASLDGSFTYTPKVGDFGHTFRTQIYKNFEFIFSL